MQQGSLEVEKLNDEIFDANLLNKSTLVRQQQQIQLIELMSGRINEKEYRDRLTSIAKFLNSEINSSEKSCQEKISNLFGLEFFDPLQNMSDVRDISIENIFGWLPNNDNKNKYKKVASLSNLKLAESERTLISDSKSSNDTFNDGNFVFIFYSFSL